MEVPMIQRERGEGRTRREMLRSAALLAAAGALPLRRLLALAPAPGAVLPGAKLTKRVVLVVFGGGVRSRETLQSDNVPNLSRLAAEGVAFPVTYAENVGHYGAAMSIFTGVTESFGIRENDRSPHATLFELLRKE